VAVAQFLDLHSVTWAVLFSVLAAPLLLGYLKASENWSEPGNRRT
jgi:hypothetical protein